MERLKEQKIKYCRYLRAKNPFGSLEGGGNPFFFPEDANTICWCIRGDGSIGPDQGVVDPFTCQSGRKCYEPPLK
ncbi:MAG TPA: hypothetical protein DDY13_18765 [Cytophagales bacterium]|jgi:hypothetical protein|nr:hypothetical protein [Cytophagales bacterium]